MMMPLLWGIVTLVVVVVDILPRLVVVVVHETQDAECLEIRHDLFVFG